MMAAHSGAAERTESVSCIGRPAELPAHDRLRRHTCYRVVLGGQQFCFGRQASAGQTRICGGEVNEPDLGVAKNKAGAVLIEAAGKFEFPFLQFTEGGTRADSA